MGRRCSSPFDVMMFGPGPRKGRGRFGLWSDKAIARTTPCLLALFSIVALLADRLPARERRRAAVTAWYAKPRPTALATPWPPCAARSGASSV